MTQETGTSLKRLKRSLPMLAFAWLAMGCGSEGATEDETTGSDPEAADSGATGGDNSSNDGDAGVGGDDQPGRPGGDDQGDNDTDCDDLLCDGKCVHVQTSNEHCGACSNKCMGEELCSEGNCVTPNDGVIPWGEAASKDWADPASAPDGLIMTEALDGKLFIEQELAAQTGGETAGFLHLDGEEMTFKQDPRPYDIPLESVWHTHPGGTSFSPPDIGNWGAGEDWGQWATVRGARGYTFVLLRTEASPAPSSLSGSQLDSENSNIRSEIFDYMIQEFGHNSDVEASHWGVFEMARRYNWVYYLGSPGSLILQRVTTDGPTNESESPGGYPASVLD